MSDLPDRAWLTPLLNQIADVAGVEAAIAIGQSKAGQQIYIPEKVTPDHWLTALVGLDAARKISAEFGSRHIIIAPAMAGAKRKRAALIADLIEKGYSTNEITRITGVARSTVMEHRAKRPPKDDPQGSLF